jgi:hypothetical protein
MRLSSISQIMRRMPERVLKVNVLGASGPRNFEAIYGCALIHHRCLTV